jgi:hypothetical protein
MPAGDGVRNRTGHVVDGALDGAAVALPTTRERGADTPRPGSGAHRQRSGAREEDRQRCDRAAAEQGEAPLFIGARHVALPPDAGQGPDGLAHPGGDPGGRENGFPDRDGDQTTREGREPD